LSIVVEMHIRAAGFLQVHQILAMVGIVSVIGIIDGFTDTHTAGIVSKRYTLIALFHAAELAALFPGIVPGAVREGIADGIISIRDTIVRGELILPIVVVGVIVSAERSSRQIAGGESVIFLIENVPALVIGEGPGGAAAAAGNGVEGIVGTDELAQGIVLVGGHDTIPGNGSDIAVVVVGIDEVFGILAATLGNGSDEGSGGVFLRAREIGVGSSVGSAVHLDSTGSQAAQIVVCIHDLGIIPFLIAETIAQLRGLALDIIGEIGAVEIEASGHPLLEGLGLAEFIVGEAGDYKSEVFFAEK